VWTRLKWFSIGSVACRYVWTCMKITMWHVVGRCQLFVINGGSRLLRILPVHTALCSLLWRNSDLTAVVCGFRKKWISWPAERLSFNIRLCCVVRQSVRVSNLLTRNIFVRWVCVALLFSERSFKPERSFSVKMRKGGSRVIPVSSV
jgi:hypothetical protein